MSPGRGGEARPSHALRAVRRHLRRRGGLLALAALTCVAGGVLLLAWVVAGGGWTPGSVLPLVLLAAGGLLAVSVAAFLALYLRRWTRDGTLAGEMERNAGLASGELRAQIELERGAPDGVSGSLVRAGAQALLPRLEGPPARLAGRPGQDVGKGLRRTGLAAGGLALVLLALVAWSPDRTRVAWSGLAHPMDVLAAGALPPLALEPGDASLPRGTVPEIGIAAPGRDSVTLHWQAVGEPLEEVMLAVEDGAAEGRLPPLDASLRYWASAPDGASTPERTIEPSDPLLLSELVLELRFPEYTRLPVETLRGAPEELSVPVGTRIAIEGQLEGDEGSEVLLRDGDDVAVLRAEVRDRRFEGEWRPVRSAELRWDVAGLSGPASLPAPMQVTVVPDRPPSVALPVPGADGDLPTSFRLPLLLEAWDDHGVARVEIEAVRVRRDGSRESPVIDEIATEGRRELSLRPVLDVTEWGLQPGEEVLLSARAVDSSPAEQEAVTREYRLRVPSAAALRESARDRIESAGERVGSLADRASQEAGSLRDLAREARMAAERQGNESDFRAREEMRDALEAQEALTEELEELGTELDESRQALEGAGEEDGGLRERLRELSSLMSEVAGTGEQERMQELMEQMSSGERSDAAEGLEEMASTREELAERLDEALERLRREALDQSFQGSEEELRELTEAQEAVSERMDSAEGAEAQDSVAAQAEQTARRLEELSRRLEEQGEAGASERVDEVSERLDEARESMEAAAEAARSENSQGASSEAGQASEQTREALEEMERARRERREEREEARRDALRRGAEDALSLARRQSELSDRMDGADAEERSRLEAEEGGLGEGIRNLAERLGEQTRGSPEIGREVTAALEQAAEAAGQAAEELGDAGTEAEEARSGGDRAVEALNRAALLALEGMEGGEGGEDSSSMEDLMQQMEELAGQQEQINQDAQSLDSQTEGAEGQMQEMASEQEGVAGGLEEMARRPGGENPGALEEMAEEARELAEELRGGRLEESTLARQEDLLERLLSGGRTLEREGPTEEREGRAAGEVERRVVQPLPAGMLQGSGLPLPGPEELSRLSPAERRMVLEYFERLNRSAAGGAGGGGGGGTP